jgi:hypothetical protein
MASRVVPASRSNVLIGRGVATAQRFLVALTCGDGGDCEDRVQDSRELKVWMVINSLT